MKAQRLIYYFGLVVILSILWVGQPAVLEGATATPTPTGSGAITLYPASAVVGQTVQISGSGFNKNGAVLSILLGSTNVTIDNTEISNETLNTYFVVPTLPKAAYSVTVSTNAGESASATLTILPSMTLGQSSGQAGDQIVANGNGFAASSKTNIYLDYSTSALAAGTTTATGVITGLAASLPETSAGIHLVRVVDASGNAVSANYSVKPQIKVDPATVAPGSETYISGSGFAPASQISIDMDNSLITNYINTDTKGTLPATKVTIPSVSAGSHIITVTDALRNYAKYTVNASCNIVVTPRAGTIGSQVTISGSGFLPSRVINLGYNNNPNITVSALPRSDGNGSFKAVFNVPNTPAGTYPITATDGINTASGQFMATYSSGLEINTGVVGATIPVSGIGFTAGATINIKFDGVGIAKTTVDANGSFSTSFQVPARSGGSHKIILTDGINPVSYTFTIQPSAQISNSGGSGTQISGYLGSEITVSGKAFTPGAQVNVHYDSRQAATPTVDTDGTFSTTFEAPQGRPGKHTVTASEGTNQFTFTFMMDSTPPAVPMLISPIKESQNEGLPKFQWSSVSDPSGVTYMLQVASEPSFSAPSIQKNDLSAATYQISPAEQLAANKKSQPYYWRVKAVDGVFNESQWSPAYTFSVGHPIPVWIWYSSGGTAILVVLIGGYILGKKWPNVVPTLLGRVKAIRIPIPKFRKKD